MTDVKHAFLMAAVTLPLDKILPSRILKPGTKGSTRYKMIEASIKQVGVVEPPMVYPNGKKGMYLLLDGHVRLTILRDLGKTEVTCLVATDDEGCTYNNRVSRLAPVQESRMIGKAITEGVSEEAIAATLNLSPRTIRASRFQLDGICAVTAR